MVRGNHLREQRQVTSLNSAPVKAILVDIVLETPVNSSNRATPDRLAGISVGCPRWGPAGESEPAVRFPVTRQSRRLGLMARVGTVGVALTQLLQLSIVHSYSVAAPAGTSSAHGQRHPALAVTSRRACLKRRGRALDVHLVPVCLTHFCRACAVSTRNSGTTSTNGRCVGSPSRSRCSCQSASNNDLAPGQVLGRRMI